MDQNINNILNGIGYRTLGLDYHADLMNLVSILRDFQAATNEDELGRAWSDYQYFIGRLAGMAIAVRLLDIPFRERNFNADVAQWWVDVWRTYGLKTWETRFMAMKRAEREALTA